MAQIIGSAGDEKTTHGPQVDKLQHDRIKSILKSERPKERSCLAATHPTCL